MVFGFLANLTNYGPKDFKGKTVKDILAMKPGKVGDDFFGADNEKAIAEAGLMREQLQAIELLMDLKNKEKIMEKCYVNRPTKRYSVVPGHSSMRKEHGESARHVETARHGHVEAAKPAHVEAAKPVEAAPHIEKQDERELVPVEGEQQGGGHKRSGHKHTRRCGHKRKRSGHKHTKRCVHKRTKRCGHKSRRSHKHTKRCGHKRSGHKRSGHKRSGYAGGKGPVISPRSY